MSTIKVKKSTWEHPSLWAKERVGYCPPYMYKNTCICGVEVFTQKGNPNPHLYCSEKCRIEIGVNNYDSISR